MFVPLDTSVAQLLLHRVTVQPAPIVLKDPNSHRHVRLVHITPVLTFKIHVNVHHAQQVITVHCSANPQLTLSTMCVMPDLYVMVEPLDQSLQILLLVLFVLLVATA